MTVFFCRQRKGKIKTAFVYINNFFDEDSSENSNQNILNLELFQNQGIFFKGRGRRTPKWVRPTSWRQLATSCLPALAYYPSQNDMDAARSVALVGWLNTTATFSFWTFALCSSIFNVARQFCFPPYIYSPIKVKQILC